jgi:hypothetical protein
MPYSVYWTRNPKEEYTYPDDTPSLVIANAEHLYKQTSINRREVFIFAKELDNKGVSKISVMEVEFIKGEFCHVYVRDEQGDEYVLLTSMFGTAQSIIKGSKESGVPIWVH